MKHKKINQNWKRIFALALAVLMALMFVVPTLSTLARADDGEDYSDDEMVSDDEQQEDFSDEKAKISALNSKIKDLAAQQTKINAEISKAKSEKEKQQIVKQQIDGQISNTTAQIDALIERIELLGHNIEVKNKEMTAKQAEIDANFALLQKRIRAMYMSGGNASTLGLVLGAENYSQFLMRAEVVTRVAQHDQDLIQSLTDEKNELEAIKKEIEADKTGVEQDKAEMDAKKGELDAQMAQAKDRIQTLADTEKAFMADKENLQKQMAQVEAEMAKIIAEINRNSKNTVYVGGVMQWPSNNLTQITCPYGSRFGGSDFHTGIDISGGGAYGSSVLAANSGTVAVANTGFTPGYGYGKYVIIDHGGGIQTLYGHCSALNVSVGDVVVTKQKIAEVGSTGWSTGPHIHFEIRQNGKSVNPLSGNWLKG